MNGLLAWLLLTALALLVALVAMLPNAAPLWLALERRRAGVRRRSVAIRDATMPYLVGGRGAPLVLIHGFGGDKDNFTRAARHLTPHFRVVIPDLPGFGEASRDPAARHDIATQVRRLHDFLTALEVGRCHLGGNSMGGFIAAQYAASHPGAVRSLWLLDAAGFDGAFDTPAIRSFAETGDSVLLVRSVRDLNVLLATATYHHPWLPPALRYALAARGARDRPLHERILREIGGDSPPLDGIAAAIVAPTLIVWGRNDRILNPAVAPRMQALIAGSELTVLEDTGHLPMVERPARVVGDLMRFIAARGA